MQSPLEQFALLSWAVAKARLPSNSQSTREAAKASGLSKGRVWQASVVLEYAPDLADLVLAGTVALNDAYTEAQERKAAAESESVTALSDSFSHHILSCTVWRTAVAWPFTGSLTLTGKNLSRPLHHGWIFGLSA